MKSTLYDYLLLNFQKFRYMLIGFQERTRTFTHLRNNTYVYGDIKDKSQLSPDHKPGYSIILPGLFLHRAYLEMLFDPVMIAPELIAYIDEIINCDDILINIMVTKFLQDCGLPQGGVLSVTHKHIQTPSKCLLSFSQLCHHFLKLLMYTERERSDFRGLTTRPNHYTTRTKCLNKFAKFFGYLPLVPQRKVLRRSLWQLFRTLFSKIIMVK